MADQQVEEKIVIVDPGELDDILELARTEGVEIEALENRTGEPVTTVSLLVFGSGLAVSTVLYAIERRRGGQVIDLRDDAGAVFYRSKDLTYGLVTIISRDGTVVVEVREPRGVMGQILDALRGLLSDVAKKGIDAIESAVRDAVGDMANVKHGERGRAR